MSKRKTLEDFIEEANIIHHFKYNYLESNYINNVKKIKILCNQCNISFEQEPYSHLRGKGCPTCAINKQKYNTGVFINKANAVHNYVYDYTYVKYISWNKKITIKCLTCYNIFEQTPNNHLQKNGCPICRKSKGELVIHKYLNDHEFEFLTQYRFKNCKNIKPLPFDFYIPHYQICIEYDGEQHFKPKKIFGGLKNFQKTIENDIIKTSYCFNNDIKLIRISYKDFANITSILNEQLYLSSGKK